MDHAVFASRVSQMAGVVRRRLNVGDVLGTLDAERPRTVWVVEQGGLAVTVGDVQFGSMIVDVVGSDSVFVTPGTSRLSLLAGSVLSAIVPSVVLEMGADSYFKELRADPQAAAAAAEAESQRQADLLARAMVLRQRSPLRRLAGTLAYLSARVGGKCPIASGLHLSISQGTLAAVADLSRQTVNRELATLRAARVVHVERSFLCVLDGEALAMVARGGKLPKRILPPSVCQWKHPNLPMDCLVTSDSSAA